MDCCVCNLGTVRSKICDVASQWFSADVGMISVLVDNTEVVGVFLSFRRGQINGGDGVIFVPYRVRKYVRVEH